MSTAIAAKLLLLASISNNQMISTVYGLNEQYCGDSHAPTNCAAGAITASGEAFDPTKPTAAIPLPANHRLRKGFHIYLRHGKTGPCRPIWVNDKKNERFRGKHAFDLSPAAVYSITGKYPTKYWSSKEVSVCRFIPLDVPNVSTTSINYVSRLIQSITSAVPYALISF